jgi:hypothetical protein
MAMASILSLLSFLAYLYFGSSKTIPERIIQLQPIAIVAFVFSYFAAFLFLIRFIKVENYSRLLRTGPKSIQNT